MMTVVLLAPASMRTPLMAMGLQESAVTPSCTLTVHARRQLAQGSKYPHTWTPACSLDKPAATNPPPRLLKRAAILLTCVTIVPTHFCYAALHFPRDSENQSNQQIWLNHPQESTVIQRNTKMDLATEATCATCKVFLSVVSNAHTWMHTSTHEHMHTNQRVHRCPNKTLGRQRVEGFMKRCTINRRFRRGSQDVYLLGFHTTFCNECVGLDLYTGI